MMAQTHLPITYQGDALLTAAYILNHVHSKPVPITPYKLWTCRKPNLSVLRHQGCVAYVHDPFHKHGKLGPIGKNNIFIRYTKQSKGYMFLGEHESWSIIELNKEMSHS